MAEEQFKLFREKSLESVESPESLNDYLKVTSPGVWLVLAGVIALLVGVVLWSIFGRIETTMDVAVFSSGSNTVCMIAYDDVESVINCDSIIIEGQTYALTFDPNAEPIIISETTNPFLCVEGNLAVGDVVVEVAVDAALEDGIYAGEIITESLQPITLLLS